MFCISLRKKSPRYSASLISAAIQLLFALALNGCSKRPSGDRPIVLQPLPLEPLRCVEAPPPTPNEIILLGPEDGCPEQFAACIDVPTGQRLAGYLTAIQVWSESAWAACKKASEGEQ